MTPQHSTFIKQIIAACAYLEDGMEEAGIGFIAAKESLKAALEDLATSSDHVQALTDIATASQKIISGHRLCCHKLVMAQETILHALNDACSLDLF